MAKEEKEYICFYCQKEIENPLERHIIAIDIPYINVVVHNECYEKIRRSGEEKYLQANKDKIFKLANIVKNSIRKV